MPIGIRENRHRTYTHLLAGTDNTHGNLATIGNQNLLNHVGFPTLSAIPRK
jgi:hypothetical protein